MTGRETSKVVGLPSATASGPRPEDGPSDDEIREKAYELFRARDGLPGDADADWFEAERLLRANRAMPTVVVASVHVEADVAKPAVRPVVVRGARPPIAESERPAKRRD